MHFNDYCIGVSNFYQKNTYYYYSGIYLFNGLVKKDSNDKGYEIIQLTELGYKYYEYIILNES